jgi:hypothetical protein
MVADSNTAAGEVTIARAGRRIVDGVTDADLYNGGGGA